MLEAHPFRLILGLEKTEAAGNPLGLGLVSRAMYEIVVEIWA